MASDSVDSCQKLATKVMGWMELATLLTSDVKVLTVKVSTDKVSTVKMSTIKVVLTAVMKRQKLTKKAMDNMKFGR